MRGLKRWYQLGFVLLAIGAPGRDATAIAGGYDAPVVKAAFLYRFTGYVDWPEAVLRESQFTIAVLGSAEVAEELTRVVARYRVKGLPARVRLVEAPAQASDAHLLYVGADYTGSLRDVIDALGSRPVLVVTDRAGALEGGSVVNFLLIDRRVRFEVSVPAAQKAGLKVSSQLLAVAAHVRGANAPRLDACGSGDTRSNGCAARVAHL